MLRRDRLFSVLSQNSTPEGVEPSMSNNDNRHFLGPLIGRIDSATLLAVSRALTCSSGWCDLSATVTSGPFPSQV